MEGATPYVLEDTRFGDVAITPVALLLWEMIVLFRIHPIDFICEGITANIDILDRGFELREGRVMAVHDGRVGNASRNEVESACNAIGLPTIVVDVMGRCSNGIETRMPAPCQILFTSFVPDSYRFDLLEFLDTAKSVPRRNTQTVFQEYLYRYSGRDWPRGTDNVSHHV